MFGFLFSVISRLLFGILGLVITFVIYTMGAMVRRQSLGRRKMENMKGLKPKSETKTDHRHLIHIVIGVLINLTCYYLIYRCIYLVANVKIGGRNIDEMDGKARVGASQVIAVIAGIITYAIDNKSKAMMVGGMTGGIASGKSTVAECLEDHGYKVICADKTYKKLIKPGAALYQPLVQRFGTSILLKNSNTGEMEISMDKLAQIVMSNEKAANDLNNLTHPAIIFDMISSIWANAPWFGRASCRIVLDVPLLFETKILAYVCCPIICVDTMEQIRLKRYRTREVANIRKKKGGRFTVDDDALKQRFKDLNKRQYDEKKRRDESDIVINNNEGLSTLKSSIESKLIQVIDMI